jgi:hypothetical protein
MIPTIITLADLRAGDRLVLSAEASVIVAGVQRLGALTIIDFPDGTATAPMPAGLVRVLR